MNQDILYITFLLGIKEKEFQLPLKSNSKLEAAGKITGSIYELDISSKYFLEFYQYVREKYGVLFENKEVVVTKALNPDKAVIEQKKEADYQPWKHLLTVYDDLRMEKVLFYPDSCGLDNEEEDIEYLDDVKRAEMIKSLVTTLPEEYRDTDIKRSER
jgi:hypothetical protein